MRPIDDDLLVLGDNWLPKKIVMYLGQTAPQPDIEKIGEMRVGDRVVIRRIGHKRIGGIFREDMSGC